MNSLNVDKSMVLLYLSNTADDTLKKMFPERNLVTFTKTAYKMGTKIYTPRCWWMWVLVIPDMFILYCCCNIIINLVQHKLIISEFCRSIVQVGSAVSSAPGFTRSKARWPNQLELLIWRLLEGMCLQAHSGYPESSRSMVVGLRSPFSCVSQLGVSLSTLRVSAFLVTLSAPQSSNSNQAFQASHLSAFSFCRSLSL